MTIVADLIIAATCVETGADLATMIPTFNDPKPPYVDLG